MTISKKILTAALLATPGMMIAALPAQAQIAGVAVADPTAVILGAKALDAANTSIGTTYKAQLDQIRTRQTALQTEINGIAAPLDTNKDGKVDDNEVNAAQAAKNPALQKLQTARDTGERDIARMNAPIARAQAYAIEQIGLKYSTVMNTVVTSKKINLLLSSGDVQFAQPTVDVTDDLRAEMDRTVPSVSIAPPANWQASQQTLQLQQQLQQIMYAQAMRAQQQGAAAAPGAAPAAPAPATGTKKPVGR